MAEDQAKPPYVRFETRSVEDRAATIAAGHYVGKDVIFALVAPAGTRDLIEREADAWLENIKEGIKQERIPPFWYDAYSKALDDFKNSRETPEFGTPIMDWPSLSPAQVRGLLDINIRTIEELADCSEEAVARIGMGGRALKQKAGAWLETANGPGKVAAEIEQLRVENQELKQRDEEREKALKALQTQVDALTKETA